MIGMQDYNFVSWEALDAPASVDCAADAEDG
jgi:hypothetical protein